MNKEQFSSLLADKGITLSTGQLEQFDKYYQLLVEWNEKMNLTAITVEEDVYAKHFYDSVSASFYFSFEKIKTVADIGAGAGFPSLPLKICFPHLQITIIDSLQKRISFLHEVIQSLGLEGVTALHGRAEEAGHQTGLRESFDLVSARAVARLNVLAEYCIPFVRIGGTFLAMKGADISLELHEAKKAMKMLGGKTNKVETFELPNQAGERNIIIIDKISETPKRFPRKAGMPSKKPLM